MSNAKPALRACPKGHQYYKNSDCHTCPICEHQRKPESGFFSLLSAPARRSLENNSITSPEELAKKTLKEILSFHGMGKASIPILQKTLAETGLKFKQEEL